MGIDLCTVRCVHICMQDFLDCGYRLIAFCLVIVGFLLNCHVLIRGKDEEDDISNTCVSETGLNAAFWTLVGLSFTMVLCGFIYDLRRKRHLEQALPEVVNGKRNSRLQMPSSLPSLPSSLPSMLSSMPSLPRGILGPTKANKDTCQKLKWFWLNTGGHARLAEWFEAESLLVDVATIENSMACWFNQVLSGVKLPVNHFHLTERPDPTVQFLDQILNDEPGANTSHANQRL